MLESQLKAESENKREQDKGENKCRDEYHERDKVVIILKKNKYRINDVGAVTEAKTLKGHERKGYCGKIEQQTGYAESKGFGDGVGGSPAYGSPAAWTDR